MIKTELKFATDKREIFTKSFICNNIIVKNGSIMCNILIGKVLEVCESERN